MSETTTLVPVPFHGDTIMTIETPDGVMVPVKPICERFGLAWQPQHRKLVSNPRWGVTSMVIPSAGGVQETTCIPVSKVFGWLATISSSRVKPEVREALDLYQREADSVLDRHFRLRAAETSARIEEQERMLWHAHQHLLILDAKWNRAYRLMEMGHSPYLIAKRCGWSRAEADEMIGAMRACGLHPKWRSEMATSFARERRLQMENHVLKNKQPGLFDA